jgi:hypothetical protein
MEVDRTLAHCRVDARLKEAAGVKGRV